MFHLGIYPLLPVGALAGMEPANLAHGGEALDQPSCGARGKGTSFKTSLSLQSGTTALFFAAQQGHNDVVRFLFEFGASTEFRTKVSQPP